MADFTIDTSEVAALALDFAEVPAKALKAAEAVMKKGAQNIKEAEQAEFRKSRHFKQIAPTVSYDRRGFASSIGFEIGPTIGGAGSLAGIAVDGGARGGGGTVNLDNVLSDEEPTLIKELGDAIDRILL